MGSFSQYLSIFMLTLTAGYAYGQGTAPDVLSANDSEAFALFESLDSSTSNSASSAPGRNNVRERNSRNTIANPVFTLLGTSRIGNYQSALLKHQNGEVVKVPLEGDSNPISGFETYSIIKHDPSGIVSLRYPASMPCVDFPEQGVSCDTDTNIATLSLTTAKAVVAATTEPQSDAAEELVEGGDSPRNPFEAIRDRGRAAGATQATEATRFQPRRIDPADVPPGMRVVSTPFGDRLVQQ